MRTNIREDYNEWLFDLACGSLYAEQISYKKLLTHLHSIEFIYLIPRDRNRAEDGIGLRRRYLIANNLNGYHQIDGPCSVLEMMLALAIRCEEDIMDDPSIGSRFRQWFWGMIRSLGLSSMMDHIYDEDYVNEVIYRFLNREYEPNGKGGLFTIKRTNYDLREVEIWFQLMWYLDTIV